jgi:hypothetical protein
LKVFPSSESPSIIEHPDQRKQGRIAMTDKQETAPRTLEELKHTRTIDTIHQDEALKVLAQYAGDESWTPEEEKKLVRRLDRKLISLLVVTYGLQVSYEA